MFSFFSRPAAQPSKTGWLHRLSCVRPVLLVLSLSLQTASIVSGVAARAAEPAPTRIMPAATPTDELEAVVRQINAPKPRKFTLRCWQHGRLIIERLVDGIPAGVSDVVRLGEADAAGVALFERRGSFCMVE